MTTTSEPKFRAIVAYDQFATNPWVVRIETIKKSSYSKEMVWVKVKGTRTVFCWFRWTANIRAWFRLKRVTRRETKRLRALNYEKIYY